MVHILGGNASAVHHDYSRVSSVRRGWITGVQSVQPYFKVTYLDERSHGKALELEEYHNT